MAHSTRASGATAARSRRPLLIATGVLVVAVVAYWLFFHGPGQRLLSPPGSPVAEFRGTGDETTPTFTVREGWQLHWDSEGERFALAIAGDRDFGTVIELDEPASGVTAPVGDGSFYLEVSADGTWSIKVLQGD